MAFWSKGQKPEHSHSHQKTSTPEGTAKAQGFSHVGAVIAVASGKGGVGKSTVATHLAIALQKEGFKVGLMDADIYGPTQTGMMGAKAYTTESNAQGQIVPIETHGVKTISMGNLMKDDAPLIWRAPIAMKVINEFINGVAWGELDYVVIDLPPGTGDVQLTLAQQANLSGAVIVTTPQDVALGIAKKGLQMFQQLNVPILGIVENMSGFTCSHCTKPTHIFKEGGGKSLAQDLKVPFLGAIPIDPEIVTAADSGLPVFAQNPKSQSALAFLSIAQGVTAQTRKLMDNALEPQKAELNEQAQLSLLWADGKSLLISPYQLRIQCKCASCVDENTGVRTLDPQKVPLNIEIQAYKPVGRYGLGVAFSDGHNTGIYAYERLRELKTESAPESTFTV